MQYWHPFQHHPHHKHPPESSWERYSRVTAPATPVLTLDEAKAHLNVMHDDDDDLITRLIDVGIAAIDGPSGIGIAMIDQTWRLTLERLPTYFRIGLGPVTAVTGITYIDTSGVTQTVDPTAYRVITGTQPTQVINTLIVSDYLPETVQVTFTCGYGADETAVPADLRHAVQLLVSHFYDVRGIAAPSLRVSEIPFSVQSIIDRYKVPALA